MPCRCGKALQDLTSQWTGLHIATTSRLSSFNTRYGGLSTFETACNVLVILLGSRTSPNSLQVSEGFSAHSSTSMRSRRMFRSLTHPRQAFLNLSKPDGRGRLSDIRVLRGSDWQDKPL
ncbi:TPA: hypothetical protein ACH3X1_013465 [Trebouxia sp. C0004]